MPGIFGVLGEYSVDKFVKIEDSLDHFGDYKKDRFISPEIKVGRLHLGTFFPQDQPIWDEHKKCGIMVDGYLILHENICDSQENGHETLKQLVNIYMKEGDSFIERIKTGRFNFLVIDYERREIKIINDIFGQLPLYYCVAKDIFFFAPEFEVVVRNCDVKKKVDRTAIHEYLKYGSAIGDRTFFEEIKTLRPATIMTYKLDNKQLTLQTYFRPNRSREKRGYTKMEEALDDVYRLSRIACQRLYSKSNKYALSLSGGIDSRFVLATWSNIKDLCTYSIGNKDFPDVKIAGKISRKMNCQHFSMDFNVNDFTKAWNKSLSIHGTLWRKNALQIKKNQVNILLTGGWGGEILGGDSFRVHTHVPESILSMAKLIDKEITFLSTEKLETLLSRNTYMKLKNTEESALKDIIDELELYEIATPEQRWEQFFLWFWSRGSMGEIRDEVGYRIGVERFSPLLDYDFFDAVSSLPPKWRSNRKFYYKLYAEKLGFFSRISAHKHIISPWVPFFIKKWYWNMRPHARSKLLLFTKGRVGKSDVFPDIDGWIRNSKKFRGILEEALESTRLFDNSKIRQLIKKHVNYEGNFGFVLIHLFNFAVRWNSARASNAKFFHRHL